MLVKKCRKLSAALLSNRDEDKRWKTTVLGSIPATSDTGRQMKQYRIQHIEKEKNSATEKKIIKIY
jgi:hypothetical protein